MLEKVRVHVDQDTADILDRITRGITDQFSETPYWTHEFSRDLKEHLADIAAFPPGWVEQEKEKLFQRLNQHLNQLETAIREGQAAEQAPLKKLDVHIRNIQAETQQRLNELETRFQELSTGVSTLVSLVHAQSVTLAACQEELAMLVRPWWRKLLGRGK